MRWKIVPAIMLVGLSAGCASARTPARDVTYGVLDALEHPPPGDVLARDVHRLAEAYVARALQAGPPEDLGKLAGRLTTNVLHATAGETADMRELVRAMVSEALRAGLAAFLQEVPALERTGARLAPSVLDHAERAGAMLVRGAVDESLARLEGRPAGEAVPLAGELLLMAQRTASVTARGLAEGLRGELCEGEGASCAEDRVEAASRSAMVGALQGVRHELGIWFLVASFVVGGAVGALAVWMAGAARRRRAG